MPRKVKAGQLTVADVKKAMPGLMVHDGNGLYLRVRLGKKDDKGKDVINKNWLYRYKSGGRLREMGLGSVDAGIGLSDAREIVRRMHAKRVEGIDPIDERRATRAPKPKPKLMTFEHAATQYIAGREHTWKNKIHRKQWRDTLRDFAYPIIGKLQCADIETQHICQVLEPIWNEKPETASRLRGRIENVLDWARVKEDRKGENPARWKGRLDQIYPAPAKAKKARRQKTGRGAHHPALPYAEAPAFMVELRKVTSVAAKALEFCILTAARTDDVIGAPWGEFDLSGKVWVVPAVRAKTDRDHRVPLSDRAVAILQEMAAIRQNDRVFPGLAEGGGMSNAALRNVLGRLREGITTHGFRSTFKDWISEETNFQPELSELALAHSIKNQAEAAYRRGDQLAKRVKLMDAWAQYLARPITDAKVIRMRKS
jgi:integrase